MALSVNKYMKRLLAHIRHIIQIYLCNQIPLRYCASLIFPHPIGIVIGSDAHIGKNVVIYQNVTIGRKNLHDNNPDRYPTIEEDVIIYPGAVIAGGIKVGANSIVGPNAVITQDVPPDSLAVGFNTIKPRKV